MMGTGVRELENGRDRTEQRVTQAENFTCGDSSREKPMARTGWRVRSPVTLDPQWPSLLWLLHLRKGHSTGHLLFLSQAQ